MTDKEKISKRSADCIELEMQFKGDGYFGKFPYNSDFNVYNIEITCSTDEEWLKIITSLRHELIRRKAKKNKEI
jgi:hypothetical protein